MTIDATACRVLVVDDDRLIRNVIAEVISDSGRVTLEAGNGVEALELLEREHVDLILLDVDMPVMGGREFCHKMQELGRLIPTVIISAYDAASVAAEVGALAWLDKPFDVDDLDDVVETACRLAGHQTAASSRENQAI